jgi:hypothetical protein
MAPSELSGDDSGTEEVKLPPDYVFERSGEPSARLKRLRPAAQRER